MPVTRDDTRARLVEVAEKLLADGGVEAVTTRAVATAAGVQAPTIYRLFGDKDGLLDAVTEYGFATWTADKRRRRGRADPVADLRDGWAMTIAFGLDRPGLARLAADPSRGRSSPAVQSGVALLRDKVHRVALAGRLAVPEARAVDLLHAAGTGVVLTLLAQPPDERDLGLADTALAAVLGVLLTDAPARPTTGPAGAAVQLRAALPELDVLSAAERDLLDEWLQRIADPSSWARLPSAR